MTVILANTRTPSETKPPRMEPLARLPVFLALEGKRAVVAGGTPAAAWKAELLSAAGAEVEVYASEPCEELLALAADPPRGTIVIHRRAWTLDDIRGAAVAIGACETDDEATHFAAAARAAGVPVNVIDKPKFCDFSFGAIVNRSPLVIGISTDGAAPVFGQAIRAKLEALIPRGFAHWAEAARRWRSEVKTSGLSFNARRRFWQIFTAHAVGNPNHEPEPADYDRLLTAARADSESADKGSVTLVGAGPGDPELLDVARGAGAAIRRRHPVRRSGVAGDPRVRPARGEENAGRQDRPWPLLQAGRDQRADGRPRQGAAAAWCGSRAATR